MPWYTTSDARRDAEKQAAIREQAGLSSRCSTFCAYEEEGRCAVTEDGKCDARRKGKDHDE